MKHLAYPLAAALFFVILSPAWGGVIVASLGTQDTTNNNPAVGVDPSSIAFPSGAAPFDGQWNGDDINGPSFSATWSFNYTVPPSQSIIGATLYLQMYDADVCTDSSRADTPVASSFTVGGTDLTGALNAAFGADPCGTSNADRTGNVNKETIALPSSLYASLLTGSASVSLDFNDLGRGVLGDTDYNGAILLYSELDITTEDQNQQNTPEPATWALLAAGGGLLALKRRAWRRG